MNYINPSIFLNNEFNTSLISKNKYDITSTVEDYHKISDKISLFSIKLSKLGTKAFKLSKGSNQPLSFIYCKNGEGTIYFSNDGTEKSLRKFQTAIISGSDNEHVTLYANSEEVSDFTIISVNRNEKSSDDYNEVTNSLIHLITKGENNRVNYLCSKNLKILSELNELDTLKGSQIVQDLLIAGRVRIIIAMEYQQLIDDLENNYDFICTLTKSEMQKIAEATEIINNQVEFNFSIDYLSKKIWLSANKLQEGFKAMHSQTVTEYIRNVRLEKAERLLKTTDLTISEVVYTVGFTSRSYFSKIFKSKYNCNPKDYKKDYSKMVA